MKTVRVLVILFSLAFALLRSGPLNGTTAALLLTVLLQLYLPGLLLARAFGKLDAPHPISRFAWVLACGLGLTIVLGGVCRLLQIPVEAYLLALHGLMLALAFLPAPPTIVSLPRWRLTRQHTPLVLLLALCCLIALAVSLERNSYRFDGYEDQTVFVATADWLAHDPDEPLIPSRRAGVTKPDVREFTDGWTYSHAAWVWTSGIPAAELIWYRLTPLFAWITPLAVFALAYAATGRERAAAWSAAGLMLAGLLTLESLVYTPNPLAFGQNALFQLNTLRTFSTALALPLALFATLSYLAAPRRRDLVLVLVIGLALASLHPRQVMVFLVSAGATGGLWLLARPSRERLIQVSLLALALASLLVLPYLQLLTRPSAQTLTQTVLDEGTRFRAFRFLTLENVPLLGQARIADPASLFYHPLLIVSAALGLLAGVAWRRGLGALHVFAATLAVLLLLFLPGLAAVYTRVVTAEAVWATMFALPIPLAFGLSADTLASGIATIIGRVRRASRVGPEWFVSAVFALALLALLVEPLPIPASARDRIRAANQVQVTRDIRPADKAVIAALQQLAPADRRSVILASNRHANYFIESVPRTLITGGRRSRNEVSFDATARFFNQQQPAAPWLDAADLAFMARYGVTHIVIRADDTRLPQLVLQPERFERLAAADGYFIFRLQPGLQTDEADRLFERMNERYGGVTDPRWTPEGFFLARPGDQTLWQSFADEWSRRLLADADDDRARLGLAFSYLLAGNDADALPLWQQFNQRYPDVPLFLEAVGYTQAALGAAEQSAGALVEALDSADLIRGLTAARALLTETFFYRLTPDQLAAVIALTEAEPSLWAELAVWDQAEAVRRRAGLLMYAGLYPVAERWLNDLPEIERSPQDAQALAALALAQGDISRALAILQTTTDPDGYAAPAYLHPDRWANNLAAQSYDLLRGELAMRDGRWDEAITAYESAIDRGADTAGRYFLAAALEAAGQPEAAAEVRAELQSQWQAQHGDEALPELASLLALADSRSLYAMQPQIARPDERTLVVSASYGGAQPFRAYPVQSWLIRLMPPGSGDVYAEAEVPARFVDGVLSRVSTTVRLPAAIPPLTPAVVAIQPRHNRAVTAEPLVLSVVLNRPDSAVIPPAAARLDYRFGDSIRLLAYQIDRRADDLAVTLYWQADAAPPDDYQVFVHILDAAGSQVAGHDSAPMNNRYPTSQWRAGVTIADEHLVTADLPPGDYSVRIGLYRLPDTARLPVAPADDRAHDDSLLLERLTLP